MVLSENDIEVITKIITQTFATPERKDGGDAIHGKHLRIDQFVGNPEKWDDWSFVFKRSMRSQNIDVYKAMTKWEESEDELDEDVQWEDVLKKRSGGLYDVL